MIESPTPTLISEVVRSYPTQGSLDHLISEACLCWDDLTASEINVDGEDPVIILGEESVED